MTQPDKRQDPDPREKAKMNNDDKPPATSATAPQLAFDPIEAALRQIFDGVSAEPVPDDFADLVARLPTRKAPSGRQ